MKASVVRTSTGGESYYFLLEAGTSHTHRDCSGPFGPAPKASEGELWPVFLALDGATFVWPSVNRRASSANEPDQAG